MPLVRQAYHKKKFIQRRYQTFFVTSNFTGFLYFVGNIWSRIVAWGICFINLVASNSKTFFSTFHWIIIVFFSKYNSSIIAFKYKIFELLCCHFFYATEYIQNMHHCILEKQRKQQKLVIYLYIWINSRKMEIKSSL